MKYVDLEEFFSGTNVRLPESITDINNFKVDLSGNVWKVFRNPEQRGVLNFEIDLLLRPRIRGEKNADGRLKRRRSCFSPSLCQTMLHFVVNRIHTHQPRGAQNVLNGFVNLEQYVANVHRWDHRKKTFNADDITYELISGFVRYTRNEKPFNVKYVSFYRDFYAFSLKNGYGGFSSKTLHSIRSLKVPQPSRGAIARFRDVKKGAHSFEEERQIIRAFEDEVGRPADRCLAMLFYETAIRPAASLRLRQKHLRKDGVTGEFYLDVPRVKKRKTTNSTREYKISLELAALLLKVSPRGASKDSFLLAFLGDPPSSRIFADSMRRWANAADLTTTRLTDEISRLPLSPYRFRRTLASNLAEAGASAEAIADTLDDETVAMALIYVNASSGWVQILEDTLDKHPAWYLLLKLFLGRLEEPSDHNLPGILGGVPHMTGYLKLKDKINIIGHCSNEEVCQLHPPLSCYTCKHFRPSRDLHKHELQQQQIQDEINSNIGVESDRMATVLKEPLYGVLAVIAKIKESQGMNSYRTDRKSLIRQSISKERPS